jgi:hypothetical protein
MVRILLALSQITAVGDPVVIIGESFIAVARAATAVILPIDWLTCANGRISTVSIKASVTSAACCPIPPG